MKNGMIIVALLIFMFGLSMAQLTNDNQLSAGQTDYKTGIEKELTNLGYWATNPDTNEAYFVSEAKTLMDCTPILVNNKGLYAFDQNGTGCPPGVFEINEGELLLRIVSMENRINDLNATVEDLQTRVKALEKSEVTP